MLRRLSIVDNIHIDSVGISSTFQVGDSVNIKPFARVLAIHREFPFFYENEGDFDEYSVFTEEIPRPILDEDISMAVYNEKPSIKIHNIKVLAISTASVVQIGANETIDAEVRIKHIRQLLSKGENE